MDTETAPPRPEPVSAPAGRRSPAARLLRPVALSVLLAGLAVALVVGLVTHASLDGANGKLGTARAGLAQSRDTRKAATLRFQALSDAATAEAATLGTDTLQLSGLDAQLGLSEAHVVTQGVRISDLDACLSGVEQALNQISLGDQAGAGGTLARVGPVCSGAEPST